MTHAPDSPAYRHIAASLAQALERLHSRLDHSGDDEPQPQRKSAAMHQRPAQAKRQIRKVKA